MTVKVTTVRSTHAGAYGLRHRGAEAERRHEVEERGPDDRLGGRQDAGRHDGSNGVRRVVEAVDEIEYQARRRSG
jgi:hypothetical protein